MHADEIKLSCLVGTLEGPRTLDDLFDSLATQDWIWGDELILVDGGMPADRRAEIDARVAAFAEAGISTSIENERQPGLVHARVAAIEASTNPWLVLLNDDSIVGPEALRQIRRRFSKHPTLGGLCPRVEPAWEKTPKRWVMALGHQALGYNATEMHEASYGWKLWEPGVIGQRVVGGALIVARKVGLDFVQLCREAPIIYTLAPGEGRRLTGDDVILYSLVYRDKEFLTAYDDSILIRRQIPRAHATFGYLASAMFWNFYSYGIRSLMRFGKGRIIDVFVRGFGRLLREFFRETKRVASLRVMLGYVAGGCGFVCGLFAGMASRDCVRIRIDPDRS